MNPPLSHSSALLDRFARPLFDLRVSVTDRCNFRCTYCMPRERTDSASFLPRSEILSFEEIERVARLFVGLGVRKIRLTGGEPLLRKELPRLVSALTSLGVELALTTNGVLLPGVARELRAAGLSRLTVSLDALDEGVFQKVCDAPAFSPRDVLLGISAAEEAGFESIKINCAVRRGENESQIVPLARHFLGTNHIVRFIEFMDVGTRNGWQPSEVVSAAEIVSTLSTLEELVPLPSQYRGEVARRFAFRSGKGEVGVIASVTEPFCGDCTRARLSSDGKLYPCLFSGAGLDLRSLLRSGAPDQELSGEIVAWWRGRADRYSQLRSQTEKADGSVHQTSGPVHETSGSVHQTSGPVHETGDSAQLMTGESAQNTDGNQKPGEGEPRRLPVVSSRVEMSFIGG